MLHALHCGRAPAAGPSARVDKRARRLSSPARAPCTASSATAECKRPGVLRPADADKGGGEAEGGEGEGELHDDEFEHGNRSW